MLIEWRVEGEEKDRYLDGRTARREIWREWEGSGGRERDGERGDKW